MHNSCHINVFNGLALSVGVIFLKVQQLPTLLYRVQSLGGG